MIPLKLKHLMLECTRDRGVFWLKRAFFIKN